MCAQRQPPQHSRCAFVCVFIFCSRPCGGCLSSVCQCIDLLHMTYLTPPSLVCEADLKVLDRPTVSPPTTRLVQTSSSCVRPALDFARIYDAASGYLRVRHSMLFRAAAFHGLMCALFCLQCQALSRQTHACGRCCAQWRLASLNLAYLPRLVCGGFGVVCLSIACCCGALCAMWRHVMPHLCGLPAGAHRRRALHIVHRMNRNQCQSPASGCEQSVLHVACLRWYVPCLYTHKVIACFVPLNCCQVGHSLRHLL